MRKSDSTTPAPCNCWRERAAGRRQRRTYRLNLDPAQNFSGKIFLPSTPPPGHVRDAIITVAAGVGSGGTLNVSSGQTSNGLLVQERHPQRVVGRHDDRTLDNGAVNVSGGGVDSGAMVVSGSENVLSGGVAQRTVGVGGTMKVLAGGTAIGTRVTGDTTVLPTGRCRSSARRAVLSSAQPA